MASRSWIVCLVLAKSQMAGLAAAKGWNASLGLHQGTPRPSSPAALAIAKAAASRGQIFQKVDYATFSRIKHYAPTHTGPKDRAMSYEEMLRHLLEIYPPG